MFEFTRQRLYGNLNTSLSRYLLYYIPVCAIGGSGIAYSTIENSCAKELQSAKSSGFFRIESAAGQRLAARTIKRHGSDLNSQFIALLSWLPRPVQHAL